MNPPLISRRPVAPHDRAFLREVYATTRADELALVDWPVSRKQAFIDMQFDAQTRHYDTNYPDGDFNIILVDGEPAGRTYVHRGPGEIVLLDIALVPSHRNRGTGTRLIVELLEEGARTGVPVRLHVERFNQSAWMLYDRLGFRPIEDRGIYILMEWVPVSVPNGQVVTAGV